jgi:hypothetical protein
MQDYYTVGQNCIKFSQFYFSSFSTFLKRINFKIFIFHESKLNFEMWWDRSVSKGVKKTDSESVIATLLELDQIR